MEEKIREKVEKVYDVFSDFAKKYIDLLNKYAELESEEENKHYPHGCKSCPRRGECNVDECLRELDMAINDLEAEKDEELLDLQIEVAEALSDLGLDVKFEIDCDACNYFNAPGWPRAYNYYLIDVSHKVSDYELKKIYLVTIKYEKLVKPWATEYKLDKVVIEVHEGIDEDTPFSAAFDEKIPWHLIRPIWRPHIESFVEEIIKAEREGRLVDAIKEVARKLKAGGWVYDYAHTYNALLEACKEFNIALE